MKKTKKSALLPSIIITIILFIFFAKASITSTVFVRSTTLIFTICAIIIAFIKRKKVKITSLVAMTTSLYVIWFGISSLYANSGKFAISEYVKILVGFAIFIFIIYSKRDKITLKNILWCTTSLAAVITFLSIEGASLGIIEPMFENALYGGRTLEYAVFNGERISSIYGISNVFATIMGVTVFLSLYLYMNSKSKIEKAVQALYMILFANGLFLVFSMGGTFSLIVAILAFLVFAKGETRIHGLLIVIQVTLISLICVVFTLETYVSKYVSDVSSGSPLPLIAILIGSVVFFVFDNLVCNKLTKIVFKYEKIVFGFFVAIIIVIISGVFFVFSQTTSSIILSTDLYTRTVYLEPGEYEVDIELADNDSQINVRVYTKTLEQVILNTNTQVINKNDVNNEFEPIILTVDEDVEEVSIRIINNSDEVVTVNKIQFVSGEDSISAMLSYKYLPDNITSRLQGLRTNNSLMTRIQYVKDGWTLFLQSPILGHGLGGFENAVQSVQKYQYETKYAHNHFIQTLVDGGIIGFITYISLIGSCIFVLIKSRKTNDMAPMLFGALTMIIVHGATEFSMSIIQFVPFAFVIFALICATADVQIDKISAYNRKICMAIFGMMLIFIICLIGNLIANINVNSGTVTLDSLKINAAIDVYDKNDYKLSYVLATSTYGDSDIRETSDKYLESLEKAKSNTISLYLADYYIDNNNPEKSYEQIVRYIDYSLYDTDTWNLALNQYINTLFLDENIEYFFTNKDVYIEILEDLIDKLSFTNESSISEIIIDDYVLMNIRNIFASKDIESLDEFSSYISTVIYDSKYDTTINDNGTYDALNLSYTDLDIQGNVTNSGDRLRIRVPYTYYATYNIEIDSTSVSRITSPTDEVDFTVTEEGKTIALIDTNMVSSMTNAQEGYIDIIIYFRQDDAEFGGVVIRR